MILATVGTQLPFPRMLVALDRVAHEHGIEIVAQTCANSEHVTAIEQRPFLAPAEFERLADAAKLIVAHAGIGTIFAAARARKPLVLYPRRASLGEHRNEHQMATAGAVEGRTGIYVARTDAELERWLTAGTLEPVALGHAPTKPALVGAVADFVAGR